MCSMNDSRKVITSNKFVNMSDYVFSEVITLSDFKRLDNKENLIIFDRNEENILYEITNLNISDNSIIFCTTFMVNHLFDILKKDNSLKNLILITHQGDDLINKKKFSRKPDSIKKWFTPNISYINNGLTSIPLGIANYSMKNLNETDISNSNNSYFDKKDYGLYVNFQKNTNNKERGEIYDKLQNKSWVKTDNPDLDLTDYKSNIKNSSFVISPWGNGVDTHRFWETLYLGSIPITKNHTTFSAASNLPVLFVNDYNEINESLLKNFLESNRKKLYNLHKLDISYWEEKINKHISSNNFKTTYFLMNSSNIKTYRVKQKINRYLKIFKYYLLKILKIFK
jgi:hypothetical protein